MEPTEELYSLVERSIDAAFDGKFMFDLYTYVKSYKFTRREVSKFIESSTAASISDTVLELERYLKGKDTIACLL